MAQVKVNAISLAVLIKRLSEGTHTCRELADETGLHIQTIYQWCRQLHKLGAIHICMWEKDAKGKESLKVYMLGEGKDAKPTRLTDYQKTKRYRMKMRAITMNQRMAA